MLIHASTVYRIESANLLNGAAVVVQHYTALPGVSDMLIIPVQDSHIVNLSWASEVKKLISQMAATEGVTEQLKEADQMLWVAKMNSIQNRAEEIVRDELIYRL